MPERWVHIPGMEKKTIGPFVSLLKKDRKVTVERFSDHIRKTYLKRRRLRRAWQNQVRLSTINPQFAPQVYGMRKAGWRQPGFVAMEDLTGQGEELDRFLDRYYDRMSLSQRRLFLKGLANFFASAFSKGLSHNDVKACNVFVAEQGRRFLFLDLEDIRFSAPNETRLKKTLVQLNCSVPVRIRLRDKLTFYALLVRSWGIRKKKLLKAIAEQSVKEDIVYVGVQGTRRESWNGGITK